MRIANEPADERGPLDKLLSLQAEFQSRLAEEGLKYLRLLQGVLAPPSPGTFAKADKNLTLTAEGAPGASVTLQLEVENQQEVFCTVTPAVTPMVEASGTTWFPEPSPPWTTKMLAPGEVQQIAFKLHVPEDLPSGSYHGALLLLGFREGAVPVEVTVRPKPTSRKSTSKKSATRKKSTARKSTAQGTQRQ